jgi:hypothetical protein
VEAGFLRLWQSLGSPAEMMLVSVVNDRLIPRLIASLPSKDALNALNGFHSMPRDQLPKRGIPCWRETRSNSKSCSTMTVSRLLNGEQSSHPKFFDGGFRKRPTQKESGTIGRSLRAYRSDKTLCRLFCLRRYPALAIP